MIPQVFNSMIALMVAKLVLNDVPHYLFSETTHRTIRIMPPFKPHKHPAEPVARVVIVPGGSRWQCVKCGRMLEAGSEAVKVGGKVYCVECARSGNPGLELTAPPRYNSIEEYLKERKPPPTGTCYRDAWRYVMHDIEGVLVHGTIVGLYGRMGHAWVELPDGTVWDPSSQARMPIEKYYSLVDPIVKVRYTADEAAHMLSVGRHGPWTAEERMKYIGR